MTRKRYIVSIIMAAVTVFACVCAHAQTVKSPCPEVLIDQKYDHIGSQAYRRMGWDTAVSCNVSTIEISSEPYIPVQYFNGTYLVEQIPYNPPDSTFSRGTAMPISTDDDFAETMTTIPYPFFFFGIQKNAFVLGANGMVTFNTTAAGHACPWQYSAPIPWLDNGTGVPKSHDAPTSYMRDAIYGVYEDTHPLGSYLTGNQGIYYGIQDRKPCRKIICSWNGIPAYPGNDNLTNRSTYQIVCYEGSNIVEVHVRRRAVSNWQNGVGIIGIQNATGLPQQPSDVPGSSNRYVAPNSPAAFYPTGTNTFNTALQYTAYRFTPMGTTLKDYKWYRIFDDGRDSVVLTMNSDDTNGYYLPMNSNDSLHPTFTKAIVSPTTVSRYVLQLKFKNAANEWYDLRDTITIGIDRSDTLGIHAATEPDTSRRIDICNGQRATLSISHPEIQETRRIEWYVKRIINGRMVDLPQSMYSVDGTGRHITIMEDPRYDTLPLNKIDSIHVMASVEFTNGCPSFDTFLVRVFPLFDTIIEDGICEGESYKWDANGHTYTQTTNTPVAHLLSQPGCDSTVHLHLTVYDGSLNIDKRVECKPLRWVNGKLYTTSNAATAEGDTIRLINRYGCDSVVQLDLTIHPLTARIESSLENFDYDHLDVVLTDASEGNDSCRWMFPTGPDQTSPTAYYSIAAEADSATIRLVAYSPYGCIDTATIVLPFNKETFWIPNAFTPGDPTGNSLFGSVSSGTLQQETFIYNRYGEMVFHSQEIDCRWDGKDTHGRPCPLGAYVYVIRYTNQFEPDKTVTRRGAVTLIR